MKTCMKCGGMKKSGGTTSAVKKIKMKAPNNSRKT